MKLYEFTTVTNEDGSRIVHAAGRISDHPDQAQQKVHITFQIETDLPSVRNGALLRSEVLSKVSDTLSGIGEGFRTLGREDQPNP